MRKIIYSNTVKHNILKKGIRYILIMSIFLTILDLILTWGGRFDFNIYFVPLIFLIFILFAHFLDLKFNKPLTEFNIKLHEELLKNGSRCDGEILEIERHLISHTRPTRDGWKDYTYYSLRIKYFSRIYNKYIIDSTPYIKNISNYDTIGISRKCVVYEKEDASIIDSTTGVDDVFTFWRIKNIINGLKIKTKNGYAFIVTEADIIEKTKVKKKSWLGSILFLIIFFIICVLCIYYS